VSPEPDRLAPVPLPPRATPVRDVPMADPGLLRSSAVVAAGTAVSRFTGFLRLVATAWALGFGRLTDTYTLANTTPNIVYELLLGGVLSATLIPVFVRQQEEGDDRGTSAVVTVSCVTLIAASVVGFLAAPWIVRIYTLSVSGAVAADQQEVATTLLRLFMPQMFFYGLTAMAMAILNARRRFAAAAFAPGLNNLVVTGVLVSLPVLAGGEPTLEGVRDDRTLLLTLGLGTTAGIVAMTLVLWPALVRAHVRITPVFDLRHPAVRLVGRMSSWTVGYVLCNQVALLVVLVLANQVAGGVSAYTGAFIFFLLPHALFAVSIMTTLVPELSAAAARSDTEAYRHRFSQGIRMMALVVLPAATGYVVLAHPIVTGLLEYGNMTSASSALTAQVLSAFGAGLFGYSVYLYALRGFYALRDTRTPFVLNVGQNLVQILLALLGMRLFGVWGLALAFGAAHTLGAAVALVVLRNRVGSLDGRKVTATVARIVAACVAMAGAVTLATGLVDGDGSAAALARTAVGVGVGAIVYTAAVVVLRVDEVAAVRERLARRSSATPA
jgi:putative peptidoglycan lipid II flippase